MASETPLVDNKRAIGRFLRRLPITILAPVLVFLVLGGWALASPVGSSPDDDFHLVSIWCADGADSEYCELGDAIDERIVPEALVDSSCFAFTPEESAGCQDSISFDPANTAHTARVNAFGGYPPVYYAVMNQFVGADIQASVVVMRFVTVTLFTALATALFLLLPVRRRPTLVWAWLITAVPLGLFVLSSNNPSSWAIMGVGFSWIALLGYFERTGWRRVALGALFVLTAVMAAGSRGDAALYTVIGIAAVIFLTFRMKRRYALQALLPVVMAAVCLLTFRFSRPIESVTQGIPGPDESGAGHLWNEFVFNMLHTPFLWAGIFGKEWGLGWLDTSMPATVWAGAFACFIAVGFVAARYLDGRKLTVLIGGAVLLWVFPALFLLGSGASVGEDMQPRYLLPLIVLFAGVLMLSPGFEMIRFTRVQSLLIWATLSVSHTVALHINMQRYIFGTDDLGPNLNTGIEWWWPAAPSPMAVWLITSVAFSGLVGVLVRYTRVTVPEWDTLVRSHRDAVPVAS